LKEKTSANPFYGNFEWFYKGKDTLFVPGVVKNEPKFVVE